MKRCTGCLVEKPASDFWKNLAAKDGLNWRCKPCATEQYAKHRTPRRPYAERQTVYLRYRYGITMEDRDAMILRQSGMCAICWLRKPLCVDHDHASGEVRGMLCRKCNLAIGHVNDLLLRRAADYVAGVPS